MVICLTCPGWAQSSSQQSEGDLVGSSSQIQPDLNLLQKRVLEFWSLMTQRQQLKALSYVDEQGQEPFLRWKWPPVKSFALRKVQLGDDPASARVSVGAVVTYPGLVHELEWPIEQQWVFGDGTWKIIVKESRAVEALFGGRDFSPQSPVDSPDKEEVSKALRQFEIKPKLINFGQVTQGESIWQEISYGNGSTLAVTVKVDQAPPWVGFDKSSFVVDPGQGGTLNLGVLTQELEGEIRGNVSFVMSREGVQLEQELPIMGSVTALVSIVPHHLILGPGSSHHLVIHNNAAQQIEITDILSSASFVEVGWPPGQQHKIDPQSQATLNVTWHPSRAPDDWTGGWIELVLARPVKGHSSFKIALLRQFP